MRSLVCSGNDARLSAALLAELLPLMERPARVSFAMVLMSLERPSLFGELSLDASEQVLAVDDIAAALQRH